MGRCRSPVRRLVMMRKRGLGGVVAQNIGGGVCVKSSGAYWDVNGAGSASCSGTTVTVGTDGTAYGFSTSPAFGAVSDENTVIGDPYYTITASPVDVLTLEFGLTGTDQPSGTENALIDVLGFGLVVVAWDAPSTSYIGTSDGLSAYFESNLGEDICVQTGTLGEYIFLAATHSLAHRDYWVDTVTGEVFTENPAP